MDETNKSEVARNRPKFIAHPTNIVTLSLQRDTP